MKRITQSEKETIAKDLLNGGKPKEWIATTQNGIGTKGRYNRVTIYAIHSKIKNLSALSDLANKIKELAEKVIFEKL